jgi:hypothetical protein
MAEELVRLTFRLEAEQVEAEAGYRVGIDTRDLVEFADAIDLASTAVAWRAAWEIVAGLELSGEDLDAIAKGRTADELGRWQPRRGRRERWSEDYFAPGQVTRVEDGSITVAIVVGAVVVGKWAWKKLFEPVVVEGWEESAAREKMKRGVRGIFGGAAKTAEEVVSKDLPANLTVDEFEERRESDDETEILIRIRKRTSPELMDLDRGEREE